MKQLNTQFHRRCTTGASSAGPPGGSSTPPPPPLCVHRCKVTFKDEPGEGSGVARSFYTAFANAVLDAEKLPNLESIMVGSSKSLQYSK